jgi:archaellum component FlaC
MQLYEMEEQLRNLDERTSAIEKKLPLVATGDDLRELREELVAVLVIQATRGEIRQVGQQVASVANDVRGVAEQIAIMRTQLAGVGRHMPAVEARKRKKT